MRRRKKAQFNQHLQSEQFQSLVIRNVQVCVAPGVCVSGAGFDAHAADQQGHQPDRLWRRSANPSGTSTPAAAQQARPGIRGLCTGPWVP